MTTTDAMLLALLAIAIGLAIGAIPPIAEAQRKRHVRQHPELFPRQYEELEDND